MYSSETDQHPYPRLISMAGLIGAGKTTLADYLCRYIGTDISVVHHEAVDTNELLPLFYEDMGRWGFALQVSLLNQRHSQLQRINWADEEIKVHIEDRFMEEDHIFATTLWKQGKMSDIEFKIYENMVKTYENYAKRPDLIVFLDVSPEKSAERIAERGRSMESSIPMDYLRALHDEYQLFIKWISKKIPVIRITWEEYMDTPQVAELIMDRWKNKAFNITN